MSEARAAADIAADTGNIVTLWHPMNRVTGGFFRSGIRSFMPFSMPSTHMQRYLTTASIAMERNADFDGMRGIDAWRAAQTNVQLAGTIQEYLVCKLAAGTPLHMFAASATATDFQTEIIQQFHFFTEQPGIEDVKQSIDDRLTHRLSALNVPLSLVGRAGSDLCRTTAKWRPKRLSS
jgi:hypothetical protein